MSLAERLFGRPTGAKLDLAAVVARLTEAVRAASVIDPELTRARLADGLRDAGLEPMLPDDFDRAAEPLDAEGCRRLAILTELLDLEAVRKAVATVAQAWPVSQVVSAGFTHLASETGLLTVEVLAQSEQRVEELARRFLAAIRATIAGESAAESKKRLDKLDYARLLREAEAAKEAAAARSEQLRKLQEEQEQRRGRRGKW